MTRYFNTKLPNFVKNGQKVKANFASSDTFKNTLKKLQNIELSCFYRKIICLLGFSLHINCDYCSKRLRESERGIMKVICSSDIRLRPLQPSLATSPFSEEMLSELRRQSWIAACSSLDKGKSTSGLNFLSMEKKEPGQPFCLGLIRLLLEASNDPDFEFPTMLASGVPLGVEEQTLDSSHIWPTKEEMKGSHFEPQLSEVEAHRNYSSALLHEDVIEQTFLEELSID